MDRAGDGIDACLIKSHILRLARLDRESLAGEALWTLGARVAVPVSSETDNVCHAALLIHEVNALPGIDRPAGLNEVG